ncbi:MFS transporter [Phaeacidiphilus oryzae]|uniref:MFS transporter n=1 Tax=Phaeacidiphilus oryzae TaxID=348818 RepID=UPI000561C174|nr:MFS transporter [Phaeacidiphilus oryzae]
MTGTGHGPAQPVAGRPQEPAGAGAARALGARIDRLPVWGLSRAFFGVLGLSFFFAYFDISAIGVDMAPMLADLHIPLADSGPPVTWGLIGYVGGSAVFGHLADAIGRRTALRLSIATLAVGSLLTACSWDLVSVTVFRTLTGFGIGAQIAVATTLAGELAGRSVRGRTVALSALGGAVAFVVTPLVGLGLTPFAHTGWRVVFALGAVSALLLPFSGDRWLPESPRWLAERGQGARAEETVRRMERTARERTGGAELPEPVVPVEPAAPVEPVVPVAPGPAAVSGAATASRWSGLRALLTPRLLRRLVLVFAFWFCWYLTIYGFLGYGPELLTDLGLSVPEGLLSSAVGNLGFLAAGLLAPLLIDRVDRRWMILGGGLVSALGLLLLAGAGQSTASWISLLVGFGNFLGVTAAYTYTSEIFPTAVRGSAMAVGDGLGHVGGAMAPFLVLPLLHDFGAGGAFRGLAVVGVASAVLIAFGVRTHRKSLVELTG